MKEIVGGEEMFVNERAPNQTCPAHMGPDTRLPDPHGATTRRAFRTRTRSGTWNWAPRSALVGLLGALRTLALLREKREKRERKNDRVEGLQEIV